VSPGGELGRAKCTSCARDEVVNADRSACSLKGAWTTWSPDHTNRRWAIDEKRISPTTVTKLAQKWTFETDGDVSGTPVVANGRVYFPSWSGSIYCVDSARGTLIWQKNVEQLLTQAGVTIGEKDKGYIVSRAVGLAGNLLVFGTMRRILGGEFFFFFFFVFSSLARRFVPPHAPHPTQPKRTPAPSSTTGYPYVVALNTSDGTLVYASKLSDHIAAMITGAPTIDKSNGYIGVSSMEESRAVDKNYPCCDARGSFVKFDVATGRILWQTYMTVPGFAGASVWGSMAPIDRARDQVIVATSNNHWRPKVVDECLRALGQLTHDNIAEQIACENLAGGENNWRESIVAMDLGTGAIKWAQRVGAVSCCFWF
jgi:polyvinyl alcohol dehydrogenase (cytochrome)